MVNSVHTLSFIQGSGAASHDKVRGSLNFNTFSPNRNSPKKSHMIIFKCKCLYVRIASLATVKICVTISPMS